MVAKYNRYIIICSPSHEPDDWDASFNTINEVKKWFIAAKEKNEYFFIHDYGVFDCDERTFLELSSYWPAKGTK